MHIHQESSEKNSIESYSTDCVYINSTMYTGLVFVNRETIVHFNEDISIDMIHERYDSLIRSNEPEVIIIGHEESGKWPDMSIRQSLSEARIGLESMSIGAACRTYNILLSEQRLVNLLLLLKLKPDVSPQ